MKLYFVGAHSTGKTTLARYASTTYKLPLIAETARTELAKMERRFDDLRVDVAGSEVAGGAEVGVHRPLPVRGDEDQAARGRGIAGAGRGGRAAAATARRRARRRRRASRPGSAKWSK